MLSKAWWAVSRRRIPPLAVDAVLTLSYVGVSLLLGDEHPPAGWREMDRTGVALIWLINLPLVVRRRSPVAVMVVLCTLWAWYIHLGYWPVVNSLGSLMALYTVASLRTPRTTAACAALVSVTWWYGGWAREGGSMPTVIAQSVVIPAGICWFGAAARRLAERNAQLAVLAAQLEREQEGRARRAVTDERVRIARELHDVVAHHLSVISVQAGLAQYVVTTDPATAEKALRTVGETTREALHEMRRTLSLLRADPEEEGEATGGFAPAPGLGRLGELTRRVRETGVPVRLRVTGQPRPLAPGAELCAYRIVQEALTNVLKHAPTARRVDVAADYLPDEVRITVTDDGHGGGRDRATIGAGQGHGLIGMRERAKLYGGSLSAGPRREGGFEVGLVLPAPRAPGVQKGD
ncbi:sensor histidine kinase [Streptomyces sp. ISL-96]|uniref:sensor histidine kinase n=1 Tax=Streptomyces sp. ISL-96 TaxID=2819191 RepID=UPI001BEAC477|nr:sensor histidine kinase [Streptomyces sp. ISL-96]MBT2488150.1 sensor histidine kinase [Streptomyces sp. ISL-96]